MSNSIGSTNLQSSDNKLMGIFRALVVSNSDSSQYGRIQARIYPYFANIDADKLPWAVPAMPLFEGAGAGIGSFCVPDVGSYVFCFFEHGDVYQPVYFAEAQNALKGLPTERITNYPNRKVFKTSSGLKFIIDDTAKQIITETATGITETIDDTAKKITIEMPSGIIETIDDTLQIFDVKMPGEMEIKLDQLSNTVDITHSSTASISINSAGEITLKGTKIYINP